MSREIGEKCVEIARQVRDGELRSDLGKATAEHDGQCYECGCPVVVVEYEHAVDGMYCDQCHQMISQAIYEHEVSLLKSGYYG